MLISKYIVKDGMFRIKNILKSNGFNDEKARKIILEILRDSVISIEQDAAYLDSYKMAQCINGLNAFKQQVLAEPFNRAQLSINFDAIKEEIDERVAYNRDSRYDYNYNIRKDIACQSLLDNSRLNEILDKIKFPSGRNITALDPITENPNLRELGKLNSTLNTYFISSDENYDRSLSENATAIALGKGSKANISNNVFDLMLLKPRITWDIDEESMRKVFSLKTERLAFSSNIKYVREGGVVVVVMPYGKMTNDFFELVSRQLENVSVYRFQNDLQNDMRYVFLIGQRRRLTKKGLDEELYENLMQTYQSYDSVPRACTVDKKLALPQMSLAIENFRGSIISADAVAAVIGRSKLTQTIFNQKLAADEKISDVRPPLPFNTGQIGLVLTSGCLDGIIEEGNNNYHIIKGRVIKNSSTEREMVDNNSYNETETISNKVEISVMLPNGEYRILA